MRTLAIVLFGGLVLGSTACSSDGSSDTPPAAPTTLAVAKLGQGGHLTWVDNAANEDEYMIMRSEGSGDYVELGRVPFDSTQYHDEPLTVGTTYGYMVMALNGAGQAQSNEVSFLFQ